MLTGIKLRKDGQQKRATCFATLLQNELKNYFARYHPRIKPALEEHEARVTRDERGMKKKHH